MKTPIHILVLNQGKVHDLTVTCDRSLSHAKLKSEVKQAIHQLGLESIPQNLRLTHDNGSTLCLAEEKTFSLEGQEADVKILLVREQQKVLPKRRQRFSEIKSDLIATYRKKRGRDPNKFLTKLIIQPLAALGFLLHPRRVADCQRLELLHDPYNTQALENALREADALLFDQSIEEEADYSRLLQEGAELGKFLRKNTPVQAADQIHNVILKGIQEKNAGEGIALIPVGYWEGNKFCPALMSIRKNSEGHLCISDSVYGGDDNGHSHDWIWKDFDSQNQEHVEKLHSLIQLNCVLTKRPETFDRPTLAQISGLFKVTSLNIQKLQESLNESKARAIKVLTERGAYDAFRSQLYNSIGLELKEEERRPVKSDPIALVFDGLSHIDTGSSFTDKVEFSARVLQQHLELVLKSRKMRRPERRTWMHHIDREIKQFRRQLEKSGVELESEEVDKLLGGLVGEFHKAMESLVAKDADLQSDRMRDLNRVSDTPFYSQVDITDIQSVEEASKNAPTEQLSAADRACVKRLRDNFTDPSIDKMPQILEDFQSITQRMDALVDVKAVDSALILYDMVISPFPLLHDERSSSDPDSFWAMFDAYARQKDDSLIYQKFQHQISRFNHYFWEAKINSGQLKSSGEESIHLMYSGACMMRLMRDREDFLKEKLGDNDCNKKQLTCEEYIFVKLSSDRDNYLHRNNFQAYNYLSENEPFLGPCKNPHLENKINSIKNINSKTPTHSEAFGILGQKEIESGYIAVADTYRREYFDNQVKLMSVSAREKLQLGFLNCENEDIRTLVPEEFSNLERHNLFFVSCIYPEVCVTANPRSAKGGFQMLSNAILEAESDEARLFARMQELHQESVEKLRTMGRLDLSMQYLDIKVAKISNYGIVPVGHPPGKKLTTVLAPGGKSTIAASLQAYKYDFNDIPRHAGAVGFPNANISDTNAQIHGVRSKVEANEYSNARFVTGDSLKIGAQRALYDQQGKHYNVCEVIDLWIQDPSLLKDSQFRRRCYEILSRNTHISSAIETHPRFFEERIPLIQELIENAEKKENWMQLFFLQSMCSSIANHVLFLKEHSIKSPDFQWPTIPHQNLPAFYQQLTRLNTETRCMGAAGVLQHFMEGAHALFPEKIPELSANPTNVGTLLKWAGELNLLESSMELPVLGRQAYVWARSALVPWVQDADPSFRNQVLNSILVLESGGGAEGSWKEVSGQNQVWRQVDTDGKESIIDLNSLQVILAHGEPPKELLGKLPETVTSSEKFKKIFSDKDIPASIRNGKSPGIQIYSFALDKANYRIIFMQHNGSFHIEQKIQGEWHRHKTPEFTPPKQKVDFEEFVFNAIAHREVKKASPASIEARMQDEGIWVNTKDKKKAYTFIAKATISIQLDKLGKVKRLNTPEGLRLVNDPDGELLRVFGPLLNGQVLFFRKKGRSHISEIHLPDLGMRLSRETRKSPWILQGHDKLSGAQLVTGTQRNEKSQDFLRSLGVNIEQCGFTVQFPGESATHLLLWPQQVIQNKAHELAPSQVMEIQKSPETHSASIITFEAGKRPQGSSAGLLNLAYLYASRRDYPKALALITQAREAQIASEEDIPILQNLEEHFLDLPGKSIRSQATKLKALLAIRHILREQGPQTTHTQSNAQAIAEEYQTYEKALKTSAFPLENLDLKLNGEEIQDIKHEYKNSLQWVTKELSEAGSKKARIPAATAEMHRFAQQLAILFMKKPLGPSKKLETIDLSKDILGGRFFEIWNRIASGELKKTDLNHLFMPIPGRPLFGLKELDHISGVGGLLSKLDFKDLKGIPIAYHLELARSSLLTLAQWKEDNPDAKSPLLDLDKIWSLHKELPKGIIGIISQWLGFAFRRESYHNFSEKLKSTCEAMKTCVLSDNKNAIGLYEEKATKEEFIDLKKIIEDLMGEKTLDLRELKANLGKEEFKAVLGPDITPLLVMLLAQIDLNAESGISKMASMLPINKALDQAKNIVGINLVDLIHQATMHQRIVDTEKRIAEKSKPPELPPVKLFSSKPPKNTQSIATYWSEAQTDALQANITAMKGQFEKACQLPSADKFSQTQLEGLMKGVENSSSELIEEVSGRKMLRMKHLDKIEAWVRDTSSAHQEVALNYQGALLEELKNQRAHLPQKLRKALKDEEELGAEYLLHEAQKAYQIGKFAEKPELHELEKLMTLQLMFRSSAHVLEKRAIGAVKDLQRIKSEGVSQSDAVWISQSTALLELFQRASDFNRYLDENYCLKDPIIMRKVLALQANQAILVRDYQIDMVKASLADSTRKSALKVGAGKTSVVLPLIILCEIEQGKNPTVVLKEFLLDQQLRDLDKATRELIVESGIKFKFDFNDDCGLSALQETYYRLLRNREEQGYPIVSAESLIDIEMKMVSLRQKESELYNSLYSTDILSFENLKKVWTGIRLVRNPQEFAGILKENLTKGEAEGIKDLIPSDLKEKALKAQELDTVQKQLFYLNKIRDISQHLIIDEIDDILDVSCKRILVPSQASIVNFSIEIREVLRQLMRVGYSTQAAPQHIDGDKRTAIIKDSALRKAHVADLFDKIQKGQQAAIPRKNLQESYLPALAIELLSDAEARKALAFPDALWDQFKNNPEKLRNLVEYLHDNKGVQAFNESDQALLGTSGMQFMSQLHKQLYHCLPLALSQNRGIDIGTSKSGYELTPFQSGLEVGTVYGEERDLMPNHYISYSIALPNTPEIEAALNEMLDSEPLDASGDLSLRQWKKDAGATPLIDYLNQAPHWEKRLHFLEKFIFESQRLKRFDLQLVFNKQDINYGREVSGMTGTLNLDSLPSNANEEISTEVPTQDIAARVLLEAGVLGVPEVRIEEPGSNLDNSQLFNAVSQLIAKNQSIATINQGFAFGQSSPEDMVSKLREKNPERIFIFIDASSRQFRLWFPGEEHRSTNYEELSKLLNDPDYSQKVTCSFSPGDIRGTNVPLPPGSAIGMISDKCFMDDLVQLLGRPRQAGKTQGTGTFFISRAKADLMKERYQLKEDSEITYAMIAVDSELQASSQKSAKNLSTAIESFKREVSMGSQHLMHHIHPQMNEIDYWAVKSPQKRFFDTHLRSIISRIADDPDHGWTYEKPKIDYQKDFSAISDSDVTVEVRKTYEAEKKKIQKMRDAMGHLTVWALTDWRWYTAGLAKRAVLSAEDRNYVDERTADFVKRLDEMEKNLDLAWEKFEKQVDAHKFPDEIPSSGDSNLTSQAQVQQQSQEQQQTQTQEQKSTSGEGKNALCFRREAWEVDFPGSKGLQYPADFGLNEDQNQKLFAFWKNSGIKISHNLWNTFVGANGFRGQTAHCRLRVFESDVCLMSRNDLHNVIGWDTEAVHSNKTAGAYSIVPQEMYKSDTRDLIPVHFVKSPPDLSTAQTQEKIALSKFFIGMDKFKESEEAILKKYFKSVDEESYQGALIHAQKFGSSQLAKKLRDWRG